MGQCPNKQNRVSDVKSLAFRLTDLCNLSCVFCGQSKQNKDERCSNIKKHYLELSELQDIIDQVKVYKPQIYLWGGEPLIYPKLEDFIRYLCSSGLNVFITTNGVLLDRFNQFFIDNKITQLTVSLEGFKEQHEEGRGVKGIYDKIISNLLQLDLDKQASSCVFPIVDINVLINELNYKTLNSFCDYLLSLGVIHNIRLQLPMFFHSTAADEFSCYVSDVFNVKNGVSWRYFTDDYANIDLNILASELDKALQNKRVKLFPDVADVKLWFRKPELRFKQECCTANCRINIEPNGDLISCTDFVETVYGNALISPIEELFKNEIIEKHRKAIKQTPRPLCARCSHLYLY